MAQNATVTDRILGAVSHAPGCPLDELVFELMFSCPDMTWNQVFLEIERLCQTGHMRLQPAGRGLDTLWLPEKSCDDDRL